MIGIDDNDEIMTCKLIFPEPYYGENMPLNTLKYYDQIESYENLVKNKFNQSNW